MHPRVSILGTFHERPLSTDEGDVGRSPLPRHGERHEFLLTLGSPMAAPLAVWLIIEPSFPIVARAGIPRTPKRCERARRLPSSLKGMAAHGICE